MCHDALKNLPSKAPHLQRIRGLGKEEARLMSGVLSLAMTRWFVSAVWQGSTPITVPPVAYHGGFDADNIKC